MSGSGHTYILSLVFQSVSSTFTNSRVNNDNNLSGIVAWNSHSSGYKTKLNARLLTNQELITNYWPGNHQNKFSQLFNKSFVSISSISKPSLPSRISSQSNFLKSPNHAKEIAKFDFLRRLINIIINQKIYNIIENIDI